MNRYSITTGIVGIGTLFYFGLAQLSPVQEQQLVDCEVELQAIEAQLTSKQATYHASKGQYRQVLERGRKASSQSSVAPETESGSVVERDVVRKRADRVDTFVDAGITLPAISLCFPRVDVYKSPNGEGYTVTMTTEIGEEVCTRVSNTGVETYREQGWICAVPTKL